MPSESPSPMADFVSVIIPTFNRAHCLGRAMRSVLSQTHRNLELIICDDASTDGTEALVRGMDDPRIVYLRQSENRGAAAARNLGLAHAKGPFIAFQDSDDEWLLDKLEMQLEALRTHGPDFGGTFGAKIIYGADNTGRFGEGLSYVVPGNGDAVPSGDLSYKLLRGNIISPQTLMIRAAVLERTGPFDERLPCNNDWEFMLRLSRATHLAYTPRPVVLAHMSADSISRNPRSKARSLILITKKHAAMFRRDPRDISAKLFMTGRYLHALKRYRAAESCMLQAILAYPWMLRSWMGFLQSRAYRAFGAPRRERRRGHAAAAQGTEKPGLPSVRGPKTGQASG